MPVAAPPLRCLAGALTLGLLAGCVKLPSLVDGGVVVGALLPFTGDQASTGPNIERALILGAELINDAGGVLGQPLRLEARDTHSSRTRGFEAGRSLFAEPELIGLIGPEDADLAKDMVPVLKEHDKVQITGAIASPLIGADDREYSFRITPSASRVGAALANRMYKEGARNIVIMRVFDEYGDVMSKAVYDAFLANDGGVAAEVGFAPGLGSYVNTIRDALVSRPDALVLIAQPTTGAAIIQEWALLGETQRWYLAPSLRSDVFVQNIPPGVLDGMVGVSVALPADAEQFAEVYGARWSGELPLVQTHFYFDALALLALATEAAAQRAGAKPTGEQIRAQIEEVSGPPGTIVTWKELARGFELVRSGVDINYRGASGGVDFNGDRDVALGLVQFWSIQDDKIAPGESQSF